MYRLEAILKEKKLPKMEFAKMLGISKQGITNLIRGNPTKARIEEMAEVLGVPVWQLFADPKDVCEKSLTTGTEFLAIIKNGDVAYSASSIEEAMAILKELAQKKTNI